MSIGDIVTQVETYVLSPPRPGAEKLVLTILGMTLGIWIERLTCKRPRSPDGGDRGGGKAAGQ